MLKVGVPEAVLWEQKPITPAALEKVLGRKEYTLRTDGYVLKKPGKPALAPISDNRPAITNKISAEEAFKEETDHE